MVFLGLFISNGPGDPQTAPELIQNMRTVINQNRKQPIFGKQCQDQVESGMILVTNI